MKIRLLAACQPFNVRLHLDMGYWDALKITFQSSPRNDRDICTQSVIMDRCGLYIWYRLSFGQSKYADYV